MYKALYDNFKMLKRSRKADEALERNMGVEKEITLYNMSDVILSFKHLFLSKKLDRWHG